jgi:hypothetical protein
LSEVMEQSFRLTATTKPLELPESMVKVEPEVVTPNAARAGAALRHAARRYLNNAIVNEGKRETRKETTSV